MAWLLLSHLNIDPNMLQTPNDSIEDIEMNNRFKIEFADLVKDAKSVGGFFSFLPILSRSEWRHINRACLPRQFPSGGLRSRFFRRRNFLQDSGDFRGLNFGEWKSWMLTCNRRRQKSKLFGVIEIYCSQDPSKLNCWFSVSRHSKWIEI